MDIRIDEMTSTVRATDSGALLDPAVLEKLVRTVLARVREEREHGERLAAERGLSPSESTDRTIIGGGG